MAQVERHTGPAPVVDVEGDRGVGLGRRRRRDAVLVVEAGDLNPAGPALDVLPASGGQVEPRRQRHRAEQLLLLDPQRLRLEVGRLLHRDQRHQLEQVVLDDVAGGADAVVVARTAADADVLGHRDLDVVDVVGVPDRLEHRVGEAQREDVLHRLLAEVVVDPEHRPAREDLAQRVVELARRLEVVAERLLDDDAPPAAVASLRQAVLLELLDDVAEELRRDREVEGVVAGGPAGLVELLDRTAELVEGGVVGEVARDEPEALGELLPDLLAELGAGVLLHRVVDDLGEVLVGPVATRVADQAEARRQQAAVGEVVDRRHDLLARQVSGDAEEHQAAGTGDAGEAAVLGVPQRVGARHRVRCLR